MKPKKNSDPNKRIILGVETSCDDTSLCILEVDNHTSKILSLNSFNQDFLLMKWGGVVPELAARSHVKALPPLLDVTFKEAGISPEDITEVAVTTHPGLVGSLLTGINLAKTFAMMRNLPIVPVNHLFAHLEAIHLTEEVSYPYLGLLVSGGHTAFMWVKGPNEMDVLGNTLDDAAGEAFDKGGKLLGVGYPAGRIIDDLAKTGDKDKYDFPISYMRDRPGKMSFSGLKTALRVKVQSIQPEEVKAELPHLCASYQEAIVQSLRVKADEIIEKILEKKVNGFTTPIVIGGGVACNSRLREVFKQRYKNVHVVKPIYCTDNAGMVANWAGRVPDLQVPFPECLSLDARSRYVEKK
ncbi:tRNA (adenosine(37)-N6)-threonylcarbamoyltransferase complex transferase subunit TsaD [Peredibacter sp. HCB2-198]|uniref:tRNA (adenosine(37)-N6)-threonylcarbamoyltransferase complex transferase subunit TsaD n=1 Tax=Peredibacter sp. HCB2-198 TaxID=3383025 RepID=UPI0038B487A6